MFDPTSILGAMVTRRLKKKSGLGTVAVAAAGAAAVGGVGYLAYQPFQQKNGSGGAPGQPQAQGWGGPPMGAANGQPQAQGWGGPPMGAANGQPQAQGWGGPPMGAAAAGAGGMMQQFAGGLMGSGGGLRTDGFSGSGYGWQGGAAGAPAPPEPPQPPPPAWGAPPPAQPPQPPASPVQPPPAQPPAGAGADPSVSLLLLRAMIAAIHADGVVTPEERARIVGELGEAGLSEEDRAALEQEIDAPKPIALLASEVKSAEMAEQFYTVSLLAIDADTEPERAHLRMLPALLRLPPEVVASVHQRLGMPTQP